MSENKAEVNEMNEEKKVIVEDNEDDILVSAADLAEDEKDIPQVKPSKWDDQEILDQLQKEMEALGKVRFKKPSYTEQILTKAMAEVLHDLGWKDYYSFRQTVQDILNGPRNGPDRIPFSLKTRNKHTGKMDFWLIRSFVQIASDDDAKKKFEYSDDDGNSISKKDVLMSSHFNKFLRKFCRTELKDEVQFWMFTGGVGGKQRLDLEKLVQADYVQLPDQNPNNLVMVQFKMKVPQERVGMKVTED